MTEFYPCGCSIYHSPMRRQSDGSFREIRVKREEHAQACGKHLKTKASSHGQPGVKGPGRGKQYRRHEEEVVHLPSGCPNAPTFFEVSQGILLFPPGHPDEVTPDRKVWRRLFRRSGIHIPVASSKGVVAGQRPKVHVEPGFLGSTC
jgi:hypothetical protein